MNHHFLFEAIAVINGDGGFIWEVADISRNSRIYSESRGYIPKLCQFKPVSHSVFLQSPRFFPKNQQPYIKTTNIFTYTTVSAEFYYNINIAL